MRQIKASTRTRTRAMAAADPMELRIIAFDMASAGDADGVRRALAQLPIARVRQLAVVAKVEGTATLNDSSRELASARIAQAMAEAGGARLAARTLEILSVGCEGLITPGGWLIASLDRTPVRKARTSAAESAVTPVAALPVGLVMGQARSAPIAMRDRAGLRHVDRAAGAVRAAMLEAGLDAKSVALVLIKSPILMPGSAGPLNAAQRRHVGSTGASRGAAALGAAIALGEIRRSALAADSLCGDASLYSARTMSFSGTETDCCEAVVFGHRSGGDPSLRLDRAVLSDLLDRSALESLANAAGATRAIFFKAGIGAGGRIRGARTTVLGSELPADKQLRAAASGAVAITLGTTRAFISGGAEHQGPAGGCLAAVMREM